MTNHIQLGQEYYIAWWNLENLFDLQNAKRSEKLRRKLSKELVGWNDPVLEKKLSQLASVINKMNGGNGPDILGVCEVESRAILQKLVRKIAHPSCDALPIMTFILPKCCSSSLRYERNVSPSNLS